VRKILVRVRLRWAFAIAVAMLAGVPADAAWAGGQSGTSVKVTRVAGTLTIHRAANFCRFHAPATYLVTIRGYFVLSFNPGILHEGGIFDTDEVPENAGSNGRMKDFGGLGVQITSPPTRSTWLTMSTRLTCIHRVALLFVRAWRAAVPPALPGVPALTGTFSDQAAIALCGRRPGAQYRLHVRGVFHAITTSLYVGGGRIGVLNVEPSASHYTAQPIPDGSRVVLYGLLACTLRAPEFELYSWRAASG
jgi:hypothetical protein